MLPISKRSRKAPANREGRDPFFKTEDSSAHFFFPKVTPLSPLTQNSQNTVQRKETPSARRRRLAQKRISTPIPSSATIKGKTATLNISGAKVTLLRDLKTEDASLQKQAHTSYKCSHSITYDPKKGTVNSFNPPVVKVTIQTTYGPEVSGTAPSGYGRGTTPADIKAKRTTLRFHEGQHGQDYLNYLKTHPLPRLKAKTGMTVAKCKQAVGVYERRLDTYFKALDKASLQATDCVGKTIDQKTGSKVCPAP